MTDAPQEPAALAPASSATTEPFAAPAPAAADPFALPPVSPDDPCGPDLDLEGDAEFLNFVAATEGTLPPNYYEFKRDAIDFPSAFQTAEKLLRRTLDVRLLTLLAKLSILNRDVKGFARVIGGLAWLKRDHWEDAHPRAEGGDYSARLGQLMTLEENSTVLLPLQYAPLLQTTREGALSYRDQLVATGAVKPRVITRLSVTGEKETSADEKFLPQKTIERLLRDVELGRLGDIVGVLRGLSTALASIKATTIEHVGFEKAVELPKLDKLVKEMTEFLRAVLFARDPTLAPPPQPAAAEEEAETASAAGSGDFASRAQVDAALASALGYFAASEPTSPALLLIRQARETLGKNLYEVMKLPAPPHAENARVFVSPDGAFTVPVKSLASAPTPEEPRAPAEPAASRASALALIMRSPSTCGAPSPRVLSLIFSTARRASLRAISSACSTTFCRKTRSPP